MQNSIERLLSRTSKVQNLLGTNQEQSLSAADKQMNSTVRSRDDLMDSTKIKSIKGTMKKLESARKNRI